MRKILCGLFLYSLVLLASACTPLQEQIIQPSPSPVPVSTPEWFNIELVDAQTGETFTINDYAGKVILLESMAIWCPNCVVQANEVRNLHQNLGNPQDLISVSLDVDINEDSAALKDYAYGYGFEWHFAIAPLKVARALGNLYTAQYLNPPLSPMMIIDRFGEVHHLEYGLKDAELLQKAVEPYLAQ
jgi:thiol-disulfide isomerase/thioredoxin